MLTKIYFIISLSQAGIFEWSCSVGGKCACHVVIDTDEHELNFDETPERKHLPSQRFKMVVPDENCLEDGVSTTATTASETGVEDVLSIASETVAEDEVSIAARETDAVTFPENWASIKARLEDAISTQMNPNTNIETPVDEFDTDIERYVFKILKDPKFQEELLSVNAKSSWLENSFVRKDYDMYEDPGGNLFMMQIEGEMTASVKGQSVGSGPFFLDIFVGESERQKIHIENPTNLWKKRRENI